MSWENILKRRSVKELVQNALDLHGGTSDFYRETYTEKDIQKIISFFEDELKRDRMDKFEIEYYNKALKLLEKAKEELQ